MEDWVYLFSPRIRQFESIGCFSNPFLLDVACGVITVRGSICPQVIMHLVEAVVRSTQGADELRVRYAVVGVKG